MSLVLILIATVLMAGSGLPGLAARRRSAWGETVALVMVILGALTGLLGAGLGFQGGSANSLMLPMPVAGTILSLSVDALGAFFLIPVFVVGGLGAIYGRGYWRQASHATTGRKLRLFWGWIIAGIVILVLARNALVFLLGWEVMALSAFMLIGAEDRQTEVRRASWIYLVATHVGTLSLFAMFGLIHIAIGSYELKPIAVDQAGIGLLTAIFFLALVGFGLKAGLMPLHFWLPSAHANAPSHVSAFLSGVMIKIGIYGLLRITSILPEPPVAWGAILLILGGVSSLLGVAFAIGQHDLKRLLAYHSVENIGIIVMGMGLAMIGRSLGRVDWVVLGMAGCLLHVWNHGLFKSLLFLSAGSVVHATHTREIDRLGGLVKSMPWTAMMFLIGAVAICGLPPLNGFISELFIYLGLLHSLDPGVEVAWAGLALGVPVLATVGALAAVCFVKAFGAVFLGQSRSDATLGAHESPTSMVLPMVVIAGCCVLIGLIPFAVAPILDRVIDAWTLHAMGGGIKLASLVSLPAIGMMGLVLVITSGVALLIFQRVIRRGRVRRVGTWDCGYARPTERMQYTASSFAENVVSLLCWILRPHTHRPRLRAIFPSVTRFESHVGDVVLDGLILPVIRAVERWLGSLRGFHRGLIQQYVLYILVAVIALLMWTMPIHKYIVRIFSR